MSSNIGMEIEKKINKLLNEKLGHLYKSFQTKTEELDRKMMSVAKNTCKNEYEKI